MKKIILLSTLFGIIGGIIGFGIISFGQSYYSNGNVYKEFYDAENEIMVSPHGLRKSMSDGKNDYILVDLRSQQEYEIEHISSAINIPAYKDPDTSAYGDVERIVNSFKELKKKNPNKPITVYCYSMACGTARKVGQMLANNGIYVKHLGIGWNEWKYYWKMWNHEGDWEKTKPEDYISKGKEPGVPKVIPNFKPCPIGGDLGC